MRYALTWRGVNVGEALMDVHQTPFGLHRRFIVESTGLAGRLKKVEYRIESVPEPAGITVRKFIRDRGFQQTDKLILSEGYARWYEQGAEKPLVYELPEDVTDYVSLLQNLRGDVPLNPGETREVMLALDGGLHDLQLEAVRKEFIQANGSNTPAIFHELETTSDILFSRNMPRGFWLSTRHNLILRMQIQSQHGTVMANLVEWQRDGKDIDWRE